MIEAGRHVREGHENATQIDQVGIGYARCIIRAKWHGKAVEPEVVLRQLANKTANPRKTAHVTY
jgi:hypothetical protein